MRRALSLLLLATLSFPLIAALLPAQTSEDLPECCRRSGKHHCAMGKMASSRAAEAGFRASSRCIFYPKPAGPSVVSSLYGPAGLVAIAVPVSSASAAPRAQVRFIHESLVSANGTRGPPSLFL